MGLSLRELKELPPEVAALEQSTRAASTNHTNSADFYRELNKLSTWKGQAGETAKDAMESTVKEHEATAENLDRAAKAMGDAHADAEAVAKRVGDILNRAAAKDPLAVEINEDTNQVSPPNTDYLKPEMQAKVAQKVADLQAEVAAVLASGGLVDADLARAIATAAGTPAPDLHDSTPTPLPDGTVKRDDPARVRASAAAFEKVFGRMPTSPSDWTTAEALNPNTYDPKFRGVGPQIEVARIKPVPGQGVVRSSSYIEQDKVASWPPGHWDIGNNRSTNPNFDPENTKVTTYIDYDNGLVVVRQNPSVEVNPDGSLGEVRVGTPKAEISQTDDGAVRIKYDSANPFAPEIAKNPPGPFKDHPVSVTGDLVFTPQEGGVRIDGTRSDYPSLEVYQDLPNGMTKTVLIDPAQSGSSLGPAMNLPFHHDVGAGGSAFEPFDKGGWNPKYDVKVPLPSIPLGPPSNPPSVPIPSGPAQF